jgi:adenylate cyclase
MDERTELIRRLRRAGIDGRASELDDEALAATAVEAALGGPGRYTLTALADKAGVSTAIARSVMQALGRPNPSRGERLFTDEDVELVRAHKEFVDAGLPRNEMLAAARILSQGMAQTADALRQVVGNALLEPGVTSASLGNRYADAVRRFGPAMEKLLAFELRAHLRDSMRSAFVTEAERESGELADTDDVAVAFADLVNYTRLGEQLPPSALGEIAMQLAELAVACAKRPAKMIKTVGDAAMFVSPDVDPLLRSVADLASGVEERDGRFPQLRVGVAFGAATNQAGDWFGPPVNLASRVTAAAKPGRILATGEVVERSDGFEWKRRRRRAFAGISDRVRLFELQP